MTAVEVTQPGLVKRRYFASARTILLVRFDTGTADPYTVEEIRDELKPNPQWAQRLRDRQSILLGQSAPQGPSVITRDAARAVIAEANRDIAFSVARVPRKDGLSRYLDVVPIRSTRKMNSARLADELEIELDWKAFPFDARLVRAILILHYEGTVTSTDFGLGIQDRSRQSLVAATGRNLRFIGMADEIQDGHSRDGDTLVIKGRDLTQLLIDTDVPQSLSVTVKPGSTVPELVRNILDTTPTGQLLRGPFLRTSTGRPVPLDVGRYPRLAFSPKELHRVNGTGQAPTATFVPSLPRQSGQASLNYWDLITDLCVSHELRPAIERDQLVLYDPRILYRRSPGREVTQLGTSPSFPSPYRQSVGDVRTVREMVFGHNLELLAFGRKFGKIKTPTIEVVGYDPDAPLSNGAGWWSASPGRRSRTKSTRPVRWRRTRSSRSRSPAWLIGRRFGRSPSRSTKRSPGRRSRSRSRRPTFRATATRPTTTPTKTRTFWGFGSRTRSRSASRSWATPRGSTPSRS